jgi:excinuclease ABC subunit C
MPTAELQEKLKSLPTKPGCYLYKDESAQIIYVGKAINLRNRVRSYFQRSANLTPRTRRLVEHVRDMEFIVTESELEALVLECNLIKKYQPHYNVRLRDDKHYPYLCVTTSEPFPRLLLTRRVRQDGNRYFGPYSGSRAVYATMDLINRIFPLVSCGKAFDGRRVQKACLYYHMGQCLAPCAGLADREEYAQAVKDVITFLEGRQEQVLKNLRREMEKAAEALLFERAAKLRDRVAAVEEVMARQKVISTQMIDQDVIAVVGEEGGAMVQMFYIRGGKLIGQNHFLLEGAESDTPPPYEGGGRGEVGRGEVDREAVQEFVKQYYQSAAYVPQEILLPCDIDETTIVQQWLRQKRGSKVEITVPVRGDKKRLVEMAAENAAHAMKQVRAEMRAKLGSAERALNELADALGLDGPPKRIECYDISNFQGDHFVGSMVVCENGEMNKSEYRRFKIRFHENKPDDFAMIREVVTRRLHEGNAGNPKFSRMPDLLIVDGGKGQLSSAVAAIRGAGFTVQGSDADFADPQSKIQNPKSKIPVAGLAKRFEHLFVPNEPDPIILPRSSQALFLVQRIRDEAHRFANAYRVTLQSRKQTQSVLDAIPGIGPKRRQALLKHFGSVEKLRAATVQELAAAPGMNKKAAESVHSHLQQTDGL